jgi:hypothetical protein
MHRNPGKQELAMFWFLGAGSSRINLGFHQKPGRDEIKWPVAEASSSLK